MAANPALQGTVTSGLRPPVPAPHRVKPFCLDGTTALVEDSCTKHPLQTK
jgi:hypothetical protein